MGRPVKSKWIGTAVGGTDTRAGTGGDMMAIACLQTAGTNKICRILRQVSSRRFLVKDKDAATQRICRLVNKVEATDALTTTPALQPGEMIMNCKRQAGSAIGRIVKMMNKTCIVQPAAAGAATNQFHARWDFEDTRAAATATALEIVQIEDGSSTPGFSADS
ncbi:MAG: hypothetical protein CMQ75_03980 [Gammaproteobacteria bacterium]|nr:hypothetical protein [Gammaproteobacteria bacterium]|tara:strand:+ start:751 stop:1239 length:489 start_codon:yes stop_codon:yes gene_type:complete